jgi:hypothetical protein
MENESKRIQVDPRHFHYRKRNLPLGPCKQCATPQEEDAKYLGLHPDRKLAWHKHIFEKREQLEIALTKMYWLQVTNFSYIKQYSNQSGLAEYNSGVRLPLPT